MRTMPRKHLRTLLGREVATRVLAGAAVLALAGVLVSCGDDNASQQQIEQAKKEAAQQQKIKDKQAQLEKELAALKKERADSSKSSSAGGSGGSSGGSSSGGSSSGGSSVGGSSVPSAAAACGGGVSAGPNTSCAFALNVATEYFQASGGSPTLSVYSPVTQRTYTMTCTGGAPTVCRGGNNAVVYIR